MTERAGARLVIVQGPEKGTTFPLILKETLIGRIDSNHLVIDHKSVSRVHAKVTAEGASFFIEDLGSRAGTLVNSNRVSKVELRTEDEITLGDVLLKFTS